MALKSFRLVHVLVGAKPIFAQPVKTGGRSPWHLMRKTAGNATASVDGKSGGALRPTMTNPQ